MFNFCVTETCTWFWNLLFGRSFLFKIAVPNNLSATWFCLRFWAPHIALQYTGVTLFVFFVFTFWLVALCCWFLLGLRLQFGVQYCTVLPWGFIFTCSSIRAVPIQNWLTPHSFCFCLFLSLSCIALFATINVDDFVLVDILEDMRSIH